MKRLFKLLTNLRMPRQKPHDRMLCRYLIHFNTQNRVIHRR